jgi:predicted dehydrogenase
VATFEVSMTAAADSQWLQVTGTRGVLDWPWFAMPRDGDHIVVTRDGRREPEPVAAGSSFSHQLARVADAVAGRATPLTGGLDSIANHRTLDAVRARAASSASRWRPSS